VIQIILLIVGVIYALRLPKLKALGAAQFPGVAEDAFAEWKEAELKGINIFLWATWGMFLLSLAAAILMVNTFPGGALGVQLFFFVVFLVLLVVAAIQGSKAAKLKKQLGIKWP